MNPDDPPPDSVRQSVFIPLWAFVVAAAVLPYVRWRRRLLFARGWVRRRAGRCDSCGYDLRVSTNRCPECGTQVQSE